MRIPAFHSPLRGIGLEDAWHDNDECPVARSIASADRRPGLGPLPRKHCVYCALLVRPVPGPAGPSKPPGQ